MDTTTNKETNKEETIDWNKTAYGIDYNVPKEERQGFWYWTKISIFILIFGGGTLLKLFGFEA